MAICIYNAVNAAKKRVNMVIEYIYFKQGDQHKFSNVEKLPPVRKF